MPQVGQNCWGSLTHTLIQQSVSAQVSFPWLQILLYSDLSESTDIEQLVKVTTMDTSSLYNDSARMPTGISNTFTGIDHVVLNVAAGELEVPSLGTKIPWSFSQADV